MSTETPITVTLTQKGAHLSLCPGTGDAELLEGGALVTVTAPSKAKLPAAKEHARIAAFLRMLVSGIDQLSPLLESSLLPAASEWRLRLVALQNADVIRHYVNARTDANLFASSVPSPIEQTDSRYRRLRDLAFEYRADIGASKPFSDSIRANVKDVWDIYPNVGATSFL